MGIKEVICILVLLSVLDNIEREWSDEDKQKKKCLVPDRGVYIVSSHNTYCNIGWEESSENACSDSWNSLKWVILTMHLCALYWIEIT